MSNIIKSVEPGVSYLGQLCVTLDVSNLDQIHAYFEFNDTPDLSRREGRRFDLKALRVGGHDFVTRGSCNHVEAIEAMQELRDPKLRAVRAARQAWEDALAEADRLQDILIAAENEARRS